LQPLPPSSVRLLSTEAIAYLITISSSSIDSLCDICSACLLPTVHPGNAPHIRTDPPFQGVAGWQPAQAFSRSSTLPRTISYTATEQVHQQKPGRSHPHTRLVGIRIRSSSYPRTIAFTATEQVHQQKPGRSHPHTRLVGIRIRSSTFLGRSRVLQSSYTSRCLADRIRI
jgi:hypothetical protein